MSRTNLLYARAFADAYPDEQIVQQSAGQIPWNHNTVLLNFETTLPAPQSDLACELLEHPYRFGFLGLRDELREREIERSLLSHIRGDVPR